MIGIPGYLEKMTVESTDCTKRDFDRTPFEEEPVETTVRKEEVTFPPTVPSEEARDNVE